MKIFFYLFIGSLLLSFSGNDSLIEESRIISYRADPHAVSVQLYWKQDDGALIRSLGKLKKYVNQKGERLLFAMNAGMYQENRYPLGLYIEKGQTKYNMNRTQSAYGNFYMQPNGVFYIDKNNQAGVIKSTDFGRLEDIEYATQSGPMLLIEGKIHPDFRPGSTNLNVRNGVGILPDGRILFAMSKERINFHDFARYFKQHGCQNALYLDGFVSKAYAPDEDWNQTGGNFGVMIGVSA